jgi:hypothetical protein
MDLFDIFAGADSFHMKRVLEYARGLSDEQLDRAVEVFAGDGTITAEQLIENNLIGHVQGHLANVRQAVTA